MDTPAVGWFYYIKQFFSSKKALAGMLVVLVAIPFTVFLAEQQQEIRQRAQEGATPSKTPTASITYPWQYPRGTNSPLPVVSTTLRSLIATIPFSARNCPKKSFGDADCNNQIDLSDVSYWQID
jgi:hypothetical protein